MTHTRKQEIIKLIIDGKDREIKDDEAREFAESLTEEELHRISNIFSDRRKKRNFDAEQERVNKVLFARNKRFYLTEQLIKLLESQDEQYLELIDILKPKMPVEKHNEYFGKIFECPDCGSCVDELQQFCFNCGRQLGEGD